MKGRPSCARLDDRKGRKMAGFYPTSTATKGTRKVDDTITRCSASRRRARSPRRRSSAAPSSRSSTRRPVLGQHRAAPRRGPRRRLLVGFPPFWAGPRAGRPRGREGGARPHEVPGALARLAPAPLPKLAGARSSAPTARRRPRRRLSSPDPRPEEPQLLLAEGGLGSRGRRAGRGRRGGRRRAPSRASADVTPNCSSAAIMSAVNRMAAVALEHKAKPAHGRSSGEASRHGEVRHDRPGRNPPIARG